MDSWVVRRQRPPRLGPPERRSRAAGRWRRVDPWGRCAVRKLGQVPSAELEPALVVDKPRHWGPEQRREVVHVPIGINPSAHPGAHGWIESAERTLRIAMGRSPMKPRLNDAYLKWHSRMTLVLGHVARSW